jgi:hypothetical protein
MSEWAIRNRSGDSETETDLVELFLAANEKLDEITLEIRKRNYCYVVSGGYPEILKSYFWIRKYHRFNCFHAGTKLDDSRYEWRKV